MKRNSLKTILFTGLGLIIVTAAFAMPYGKPNILITGYEVDFVSSSETEVTIKCKVTEDGGSPVTHFIGEVRFDDVDRWNYTGIRNADWFGRNKYDYLFDKLPKGQDAMFRVQSATKYEKSDFVELNDRITL